MLDTYKSSNENIDYIFIDTYGFNIKDYVSKANAGDIIDAVKADAYIYLAVPASMKYSDLEQLFDCYESFGYRSVIVTKCDETSTFGNVLSILHKTKKPLSWITEGQEILNTMKRASIQYFKERIFVTL